MRAIKAIMKRNLTAFWGDPGRLVGTLIMPLLMFFTCTFAMKSADGIEDPINYLIAGIAVMIVFQGALNNSTAALTDIASGFMKEIIVAPVDRKNIAVGNILSAALLAVIQGVFVLLIGLPFGFRTTISGFLLMVLIMIPTGIVFSAVALFLSLVSKNQTNYQMISSIVIFPAMFLSGAYIPTFMIPRFLQVFVYINPLTYLTGAFRYVALGMNGLSTEELVSQGVAYQFGGITITPAVTWIFILTIGVIFFALCVYKFKRVNLGEMQGRTSGRRG